jgi:serine/threonine protein kinase
MKSIGHYEIVSVLGDGGMGTVYRAKDPRFDRDVAIKILHAQYQHDEEVLERFKTEAIIQAKLNHPHIVSVFDFIADGERYGLVMEFLDGQPLDRLLAAHGGRLPHARATNIMRQVLGAVGVAHAQGLVHRDIKPSNIAVLNVGGDDFAKIMDFGVAKVLGSEKQRTATGARIGTLAYMSPEQLTKPKDVDHRTDIYALGVTLYEMLTGRVPFDGDTEYGLMRQIIEEDVRIPGPAEAGGVGHLGPVLRTAMARRASDRFQSCDAFVRAIEGGGAGAESGRRTAGGGDRIAPNPSMVADELNTRLVQLMSQKIDSARSVNIGNVAEVRSVRIDFHDAQHKATADPGMKVKSRAMLWLFIWLGVGVAILGLLTDR